MTTTPPAPGTLYPQSLVYFFQHQQGYALGIFVLLVLALVVSHNQRAREVVGVILVVYGILAALAFGYAVTNPGH